MKRNHFFTGLTAMVFLWGVCFFPAASPAQEAAAQIGRPVRVVSIAFKPRSLEAIAPLVEFAVDGPGLGNVPEIFDGDPPQRPAGCFAHAWSGGELIRSLIALARAQGMTETQKKTENRSQEAESGA